MGWNAKNTGGYYRESTEAYDNCVECWNVLGSRGWTLNAVSGLLGSQEYESAYNPWRWESDVVLPHNSPLIPSSRTHGYGLFQFTPSGKYILDGNAQSYPEFAPNFSDQAGLPTDGIAQLKFMDEYGDYIPTRAYPLSFSQFKVSTDTPEYLAGAWVYNYERPASPSATIAGRREAARYWYQVLQGLPPIPPGPVPGEGKKFKFWLYGRSYTRRQRR